MWPGRGLNLAGPERGEEGLSLPGAVAGAGALSGDRVPLRRRVLGIGSIYLEGPGYPSMASAVPCWVAGARMSTAGSCSISHGDFPYLLVFAGGLAWKRLASPARRSGL